MKTYTTKELGHDLKKILTENNDIDVAEIGRWCDFILFENVNIDPDLETDQHLKALSMMQEPELEFSHEELLKIADCFIEGIEIDLYKKDPFENI